MPRLVLWRLPATSRSWRAWNGENVEIFGNSVLLFKKITRKMAIMGTLFVKYCVGYLMG
jgi:hypothetical protein